MTSRIPAPLGRSEKEQEAPGIGLIHYVYDEGVNGLGRLAEVWLGKQATIEYQYDARGQVTEETRGFDLSDGVEAKYLDTRTASYHCPLLGGLKPSPSGDSFSMVFCGNVAVWDTGMARIPSSRSTCTWCGRRSTASRS